MDETYPAKTTGMVLPYGKNCIHPTVFDWSTRVTDRRAIAHSALSILLSRAKICISQCIVSNSTYCCLSRYKISANFRVFHSTVWNSQWTQCLVAKQFKNSRLNIWQSVNIRHAEYNTHNICKNVVYHGAKILQELQISQKDCASVHAVVCANTAAKMHRQPFR